MSNLVDVNGQSLARRNSGACQVCHLPVMMGNHGTVNQCFKTLQAHAARLAAELLEAKSVLNVCAFFPVASNSGHIEAVGFRRLAEGSPACGGILIKFRGGKIYYSEATNIPIAEFGALLAAESAGGYFKRVLEPKYKFLRWTAPQAELN